MMRAIVAAAAKLSVLHNPQVGLYTEVLDPTAREAFSRTPEECFFMLQDQAGVASAAFAIAESAEHQVEVYFEPRWRFKIYTPAWRFAVIAAILVEANDSYASEIASLLAALV